MFRILFILGTRPEAIKLAPLILHQKSRPEHFNVRVCVTGQHRDLLDQVLEIFQISPDFDLDAMLPGQTLCESSARILAGIEKAIVAAKPDALVVQGDTTTTVCGAMAGFYRQVPVAHVEAGLRTGDMQQPFPEEMNRVLTSRLAKLHFAPTQSARENLLGEGCDRKSVFVTGNSGIDAVLQVRDWLAEGALDGGARLALDSTKKLILVTAHRRENFGSGLENLCAAVAQIATRRDVQIVFPVHPNPQVSAVVRRMLGRWPNVALVGALGYVEFVDLMRRSYLILTDSGGIQEEAPSLGKPVLLLRDKTERMEGVWAGTVKLVGTCTKKIVFHTTELLEDTHAYAVMARAYNPYGDGTASQQISKAMLAYFGQPSTRRAKSTYATKPAAAGVI